MKAATPLHIVLDQYIQQGFIDHLCIRPDGLICCRPKSDMLYDQESTECTLVIHEESETNIFLIESKDGFLKGIATQPRDFIL